MYIQLPQLVKSVYMCLTRSDNLVDCVHVCVHVCRSHESLNWMTTFEPCHSTPYKMVTPLLWDGSNDYSSYYIAYCVYHVAGGTILYYVKGVKTRFDFSVHTIILCIIHTQLLSYNWSTFTCTMYVCAVMDGHFLPHHSFTASLHTTKIYICMYAWCTLYGILHVFLHTHTYIHTPVFLLPSGCKSWHSQLLWPPLRSNKLVTVLIQSSFFFLLELQLALPSQFFNKQSSLSSSLNLLLSILQALRVCQWDGCAAWLHHMYYNTHRSCSSRIYTCHMTHDTSTLDTRHLFLRSA